MDANEVELLALVLGDLHELKVAVSNETLDRSASIRMSGLLRKLCIDGLLQHAGTVLGIRLRVDGSDFLPEDSTLQKSATVFAHAPQCDFTGRTQRRLLLNKGERAAQVCWGAARSSISIDQFCAERVLAWGHFGVTRGEVILYVANKLGGVHWDKGRGRKTRKDFAFAVLDALRENVVASVSSDGLAYKLRVKSGGPSDSVWRKDFVLRPDHLDIPMLDLFFTAKLLLRSPAVIRLVGSIENVLDD